MFWSVLPLLLAAPAWAPPAQPKQEDRLAHAARDPYALAEYLASVPLVNWSALGRLLGVQDLQSGPCASRPGDKECAPELIVVSNPKQAVVAVGDWSMGVELYLRYTRAQPGVWRFEGMFENELRYYPRRHDLVRDAGITILKVSGQGARGTGLHSEMEYWFDLTQPGFKPAFQFEVEGLESRLGRDGVSRKCRTSALLLSRDAIQASTTLSLYAEDGDNTYGLAETGVVATYVREPTGSAFRFKAANTGPMGKGPAISLEDYEALTQVYSEISDEDLIRLNFAAIKKTAAGMDGGAKNWLRGFLPKAKDTPEVRELRALLR